MLYTLLLPTTQLSLGSDPNPTSNAVRPFTVDEGRKTQIQAHAIVKRKTKWIKVLSGNCLGNFFFLFFFGLNIYANAYIYLYTYKNKIFFFFLKIYMHMLIYIYIYIDIYMYVCICKDKTVPIFPPFMHSMYMVHEGGKNRYICLSNYLSCPTQLRRP